jgi:hypothetical protein
MLGRSAHFASLSLIALFMGQLGSSEETPGFCRAMRALCVPTQAGYDPLR